MTEPDLRRLMAVTGFENTDDLWWRLGATVPDGNGGWTTADPDRLHVFVNVNDVFAWGGSDVEEIAAGDEALLEQAYADAAAATGDAYESGAVLYAARKRGMRPQGALYKHLPEALWPLLDACGPARQVGLGNPVAHPSDPAAPAPEQP